MPSTTTLNGGSTFYRWALGGILGVLVTFFGLRENYIFTRLDKVESRMDKIDELYKERSEKFDKLNGMMGNLEGLLKERTAKFEAIIKNQEEILKRLEKKP